MPAMSRLHVFLHHLRGGFATNCSSSHSLIYLPGAQDDLSNVRDGVYDYGFVLASRAAKLPYIRFELEASGGLDDEIQAELGLPEEGARQGDDYTWSAPPEMAKEIARWALMDGVVALAGDESARAHLAARLDDSNAEVREIAADSLAALDTANVG